MKYLFNDYESRGYKDLKAVGHHEYLKSAEILCVGVGIGPERPCIEYELGLFPEDEYQPISWGRFDYYVYRELESFTYPSERWIDAQALALYLGFPRGLESFCRAIGLDAKKDPRGTRLINKYCKPNENGEFNEFTEEDWVAFQDYCIQDVVLLQKAWYLALEQFHEPWENQWRENYELIQRMNERGVPIDRTSALVARRRAEKFQEELREECYNLVGFYPTQVPTLRSFLGTKDVAKATLESTTFDDPQKERVKEIRLATSKAAAAKLNPMIAMSASDGRVRGCFVSNGAHTGRGTSQDCQFHNMKRQKIDDRFFEELATWPDPLTGAQENIRGFVKAPEGRVFAIADYAQIESRIIAWLSGSKGLLDAFSDGSRDVYCEFASRFYGREISKGDDERQLGKVAILGTGFGVSGKGLARQAPDYGIEITEHTGKEVVAAYNDMFPEVKRFRERLVEGAVRCIRDKRHRESVGPIDLGCSGDFLVAVLPSGRQLRYWKPTVVDNRTFEFSRRLGNGTVRTRMWHGAMTENVVQAIAADIKLDAMLRLESVYKAEIIFEVHDEIITEVNENEAETMLQAMLGAMSHPPDYVPKDLIIAEGAIVKRYTKV